MGDRLPSDLQPHPNSLGEAFLSGRDGFFAGQLLSLPGGIHFRRLDLKWTRQKDVSSINALVGRGGLFHP